jgi:aryl-alcohol dehydrogenase-like predicted oxidoreductase
MCRALWPRVCRTGDDRAPISIPSHDLDMRTSLPTRQLGTTDLDLTRVGFGAWAVGGGGWAYGWGPQDDADSIAAIRHAVERGINWIDTAAVYGLGHSEAVVGRAIASLPADERPFVFTKGGLVWNDRDRTAPPVRNLDPASIRRECEASLTRLGVERIDLYQFHWPDQTGVAVEDSWAEVGRLIDEGKVRAGGVSNFDVPLLERCERVRHVDSLQPRLSLINHAAAEREIAWCRAHGAGVIAYGTMHHGLLTDTFSRERVASFAEDDWRRSSRDFTQPLLTRHLVLRDALHPIAARHATTIAAVAVAWALTVPGVTGAIVGARTPAQIDDWIRAATLELTREDLEEIGVAMRAHDVAT